MNQRLEILRKSALGSHIPVMRPETANLLAQEIRLCRPQNVLEIGTCIGLGVITMLYSGAERVTSIEIDEDRFWQAKANIKEFGLSERCEILLGDCKEILPLMENNRYDFVVLDGPKSYYIDAYPYIKKMLTSHGKIFADDVKFYGMVEGEENPKRKHRTNVNRLREFIVAVKSDSVFDCKEYDIEDGVIILSHREKDPQ